MPYENETLNSTRLRDYAKRVAKQGHNISPSQLARTELAPDKRWWQRSRRAAGPVMQPLDGWIFLVNRYDGFLTHVRGRDGDYYRGIEHGELLILTTEGDIECAGYGIDSYAPIPGASRQDHRLSDHRVATDQDLTNFDRLNRGGYRDVRPRRPASGETELWRSELRLNCRIKVPHPGMEVSLALKRLLDQQQYTQRLYINQHIGI